MAVNSAIKSSRLQPSLASSMALASLPPGTIAFLIPGFFSPSSALALAAGFSAPLVDALAAGFSGAAFPLAGALALGAGASSGSSSPPGVMPLSRNQFQASSEKASSSSGRKSASAFLRMSSMSASSSWSTSICSSGRTSLPVLPSIPYCITSFISTATSCRVIPSTASGCATSFLLVFFAMTMPPCQLCVDKIKPKISVRHHALCKYVIHGDT